MNRDRDKIINEFNEAFAKSDVDTILKYVSEDIKWNIIGDRVVEGKENFANYIREMASQDPMDFSLNTTIHQDLQAVLEGQVTSSEGKVYAFCDIYTFDGIDSDKISSLISYVIEVSDQK